MIKIIFDLLLIILYVLIIILFVRQYKSIKSPTEKILYYVFYTVMLIPVIIYYLDKYDLPSKFGLLKNNDSERWFVFIEVYLSSIIGSFISGIVLVLITFKQIRIQLDNSNDDKRIQNAPIFKYDIKNTIVSNAKPFIIKCGEDHLYSLFVNIENVGLNHARNIKIEVADNESILLQKTNLDDRQSIIKKNENVWIDLAFNFKHNEKKQMENTQNLFFNIYYDDLLKNKYVQSINIQVEPTNKTGSSYVGYMLDIKKIVINSEAFISWKLWLENKS